MKPSDYILITISRVFQKLAFLNYLLHLHRHLIANEFRLGASCLYRMPKEISEWQEGFWFEARRRPQALSGDSDRLAAFRWEESDGAADFYPRQGVSHEHIP